MTMPHLMNCQHTGCGWCLDCVKDLWNEAANANAEEARMYNAIKTGGYGIITTQDGLMVVPLDEPKSPATWLNWPDKAGDWWAWHPKESPIPQVALVNVSSSGEVSVIFQYHDWDTWEYENDGWKFTPLGHEPPAPPTL
jgi:hypothetical protein